MLSARAAVARAARGRLWNHGRRQLDGQLRAAGEALRLPFVWTWITTDQPVSKPVTILMRWDALARVIVVRAPLLVRAAYS